MARTRQFREINRPCLLMLLRNLTRRTQEVENADLQTPASAHGSLSPNLLYKLQVSPLQASGQLFSQRRVPALYCLKEIFLYEARPSVSSCCLRNLIQAALEPKDSLWPWLQSFITDRKVPETLVSDFI